MNRLGVKDPEVCNLEKMHDWQTMICTVNVMINLITYCYLASLQPFREVSKFSICKGFLLSLGLFYKYQNNECWETFFDQPLTVTFRPKCLSGLMALQM